MGNFKAVVIYNNADEDKIRILTENRHKVAVYRWVNKVNGNIYIGSSTSLHVRMYTYFSLRSLAKSNRPIDRALLKHGFSKFRLEILEYCSYKDVLKREQHYLDLYKPHYNIATVAGSTLGYKHSQESLEKLRNIVLSDEVRERKIISTLNASIANRLPICVKNIITKDVTSYASMPEAGKALGVTRATVSQALLQNRLIKKTYSICKIK